MSPALLKVEAIDKVFASGQSSIQALQGVSLEIESGEFVALMGSSGCGKSTLLHLMAGLDRPSKGKIFFEEIELSALDQRELALMRGTKMGFIFQNFNLVSSMSAIENVELPLLLRSVSRSERRTKSESLLKRVGLGHRTEQNVKNLSGGEMQRTAIARALIVDPVLLFADEPTGNLDENSSGEVISILEEICREGATVVLATHDAEVAARCDKIIRLQNGSIVNEVSST